MTPPTSSPAHRSTGSAKNGSGAGNGAATAPKRIGIREIARRANVSVATVSMVLNQNPKITEATAKRVRSVIDETGYQPNRIAQSLSGKYTRMLGVLLPTLRHALADPYFGEIISGIVDKADRFGHKVMIESAKPDFIRERKHLELFERRFVDGVLCIGFNDRHSFLKDFAKAKRPMIVVNNTFPGWGIDHIVCDYVGGAEQVMTYLEQLGHERIGLIHGSPNVHTARAVRDVYERRMKQRGLPGLSIDDGWMLDGKFTEDGGREAAQQLLDQHPDLTALFCGNDKMAMGAIQGCVQRGRLVPRDVSVVGFDDIASGAYICPSLTTVHLPLHEAGALACEKLIGRVRGTATPTAETLPTHLVLRGSTGIVTSAGAVG